MCVGGGGCSAAETIMFVIQTTIKMISPAVVVRGTKGLKSFVFVQTIFYHYSFSFLIGSEK